MIVADESQQPAEPEPQGELTETDGGADAARLLELDDGLREVFGYDPLGSEEEEKAPEAKEAKPEPIKPEPAEPAEEAKTEPAEQTKEERWTYSQARRFRKDGEKALAAAQQLQQQLQQQQQQIAQQQQQWQARVELMRADPERALQELAKEAGYSGDAFYQRLTERRLHDGPIETEKEAPETSVLRKELADIREQLQRAEQERQHREATATYQRDVNTVLQTSASKASEYPYLESLPAEQKDSLIAHAVELVTKARLRRTPDDVCRVLDEHVKNAYTYQYERLQSLIKDTGSSGDSFTNDPGQRDASPGGQRQPQRSARKAGQHSSISNQDAAETSGARREQTDEERARAADAIFRDVLIPGPNS